MSLRTEIVVTDLTRFNNKEVVCMAGVTSDGGTCIRPLPYLSYEICKKHGIFPGAVISGNFSPVSAIHAPHVEDMDYDGLRLERKCSSSEFQSVLDTTVVSDLQAGFGTVITGKVIAITAPAPKASIVTLKVDCKSFWVNEDGYGKIRASIDDPVCGKITGLSITDLGFFDNVGSKEKKMSVADANNFIHGQDDLYLRVGLGRQYKAPDGRDGYWIQINGIYTFPQFSGTIRSY